MSRRYLSAETEAAMSAVTDRYSVDPRQGDMLDGLDGPEGLDGSRETPVETVETSRPADGLDTSDGLDGSPETPSRTVLDAVRDHLAAYLSPASDDDLDVLALWAVHTHLASETYTTPRLLITSPMAGSGKTTVLEHLERLAPHATPMSSVSSSAMIPRLIAATPTVLLIDEAEKALSPNKPGIEDVLGVLNSGYKIGGSRPVLVPSKEDGWRAESLPTFAPVAMAGNAPDLPEDTMQRTITVTMFPATEGDVEETDWELLDMDVRDLGQRIAAWADSIRDDVRRTRPEVPRGCVGRIKERWLPLKRVAYFAGGDWPERVDRMIRDDLDQMARDREEGLSTMPIHVHLIRDLHDLFTEQGSDFLPTSDIIRHLIAKHPERWSASSTFGRDLTAQRLGRMLVKNFTIRSGKDVDDTRGYHRATFARAWRAVGLEDTSRRFDGTLSSEPSKPSEQSEASACPGCLEPHCDGDCEVTR
ncbi:DUF3631 domain-containing protein [Brachybacterium paraconglomeratum]|uniref:DUF3631 domain-containing protein n=1 Tax=Brachybacterium paraconglomeratum TaxID=173362 RepID=UPI0021A53A50|nr:DUF3631 domain-containing protein [Brachybacterium paraconglomeratum]MCT1909668.1 DUF3631 domain-containing protein [Brachybacterium paraconglomeratum]